MSIKRSETQTAETKVPDNIMALLCNSKLQAQAGSRALVHSWKVYIYSTSSSTAAPTLNTHTHLHRARHLKFSGVDV
eukprot:1136946-Pelagomonas_calceolata.AAC.3